MTTSGRMRFRARRVAMRRISCIDQRISEEFVSSEVDGASWLCGALFWGRRGFVGVNADRRHHGEGEHDQRHVTTPAMPGARLVVIEAEFVLRRFETVFDRPTMSFDFRQSFDGRSARSPCLDAGGSRRRLLFATRRARHRGVTQTKRPPANPGRFRSP